MKRFKRFVAVFLGTVISYLCSADVRLHDVSFNESYSLNGKQLILNGVGTRVATMFRVKVYVAGLYMLSKVNDASAIISSSEPSVIRLVLKRDVTGKDIQDSLDDSFEGQCKLKQCYDYQSDSDKLRSIIPNLKENAELVIELQDGVTTIKHNGEIQGKIESRELVPLILGAWIGPKPPNEELKNGLLGLSVQ